MRITGESAAIQIKNYIESHSYLENTDIILLVISDHEYLLRKVNQIQKNKGLCVRLGLIIKIYGVSNTNAI